MCWELCLGAWLELKRLTGAAGFVEVTLLLLVLAEACGGWEAAAAQHNSSK
jgi:hypothetical protein